MFQVNEFDIRRFRIDCKGPLRGIPICDASKSGIVRPIKKLRQHTTDVGRMASSSSNAVFIRHSSIVCPIYNKGRRYVPNIHKRTLHSIILMYVCLSYIHCIAYIAYTLLVLIYCAKLIILCCFTLVNVHLVLLEGRIRLNSAGLMVDLSAKWTSTILAIDH